MLLPVLMPKQYGLAKPNWQQEQNKTHKWLIEGGAMV